MFTKIKSFLIGVGIAALIAVFYLTGKKLQINKLKKLLKKDYNNKVENLTDTRKVLKKELAKSKGKDPKVRDKISELDKKRKEIKGSVKKMDKSELSSSIDAWFKSRQ